MCAFLCNALIVLAKNSGSEQLASEYSCTTCCSRQSSRQWSAAESLLTRQRVGSKSVRVRIGEHFIERMPTHLLSLFHLDFCRHHLQLPAISMIFVDKTGCGQLVCFQSRRDLIFGREGNGCSGTYYTQCGTSGARAQEQAAHKVFASLTLLHRRYPPQSSWEQELCNRLLLIRLHQGRASRARDQEKAANRCLPQRPKNKTSTLLHRRSPGI